METVWSRNHNFHMWTPQGPSGEYSGTMYAWSWNTISLLLDGENSFFICTHTTPFSYRNSIILVQTASQDLNLLYLNYYSHGVQFLFVLFSHVLVGLLYVTTHSRFSHIYKLETSMEAFNFVTGKKDLEDLEGHRIIHNYMLYTIAHIWYYILDSYKSFSCKSVWCCNSVCYSWLEFADTILQILHKDINILPGGVSTDAHSQSISGHLRWYPNGQQDGRGAADGVWVAGCTLAGLTVHQRRKESRTCNEGQASTMTWT